MRGEQRIALKALIGVCAGLLLASCESLPPDGPYPPGPAQAQVPAPPMAPAPVSTALAPPPPPMATEAVPPPTASVSYPRYGDSDDYLCNFAPPGDPRSLQACIRLRGPDAFPQPPARYGATDDFVCHHGAPGDPRTTQACLRLHPPEP